MDLFATITQKNEEEIYKWTPIHSCDELTSGSSCIITIEDYTGARHVLKAGFSDGVPNYVLEKMSASKTLEDLPKNAYQHTVYSRYDSLYQFVTPMDRYTLSYVGGYFYSMSPSIRNSTTYVPGETRYDGLWGSYNTDVSGILCWHIEPIDRLGHFYIRSTTNSSIGTPVNNFLSYDPNKGYMVSRKSYTPIDQWEEDKTLAECTSSTQRAAAWTIYRYIRQYYATFCLGDYATWDGTDRSNQVILGASTEFPIPIADDGWIFIGWNTKADGTGQMLSQTANFITMTSDTTLYAVYAPNLASHLQVLEWNAESIVIQTGEAVESATTQVLSEATYKATQYGIPLSKQDHLLSECLLPNDVGVYTLYFNADEVREHAGEVLNITLYDANENPIGLASLPIPLIITDSRLASTYSDELLNACDIYVDNKAVLTIDNDCKMKGVHILGGGKVTVQANCNWIVEQLIMQGGAIRNGRYYFRYPQLVANGHIQVEGGQIYYDYLLNAKQYYSLALPFDVSIHDIQYQDGSPAVRRAAGVGGFDYDIQYYDGELRTTGASGWKMLPNTAGALQAGQGYIVAAFPPFMNMVGGGQAVPLYGVLRFPMSIQDLMPEQQKIVPVTRPGFTDTGLLPGIKVNDAGWNLVGNPYLSAYKAEDGLTTNGISLLVQNASGEYSWLGTSRYVVIPANDGRSYAQVLSHNAQLPAFKNFFVQIGNGDALEFALSHRSQQIPQHRRVASLENELSLGLKIMHNQVEDNMGILYGSEFTQDYEINADLAKWNNADLNLYAISQQDRLAFIALSITDMASVHIGYEASTAGTFTICLDSAYDYSRFDAVLLYDAMERQEINLLDDAYSFSTTQPMSNSRFSVSVVLKQSSPATNLDIVKDREENRWYDLWGRVSKPSHQGIYIFKTQHGCHKIVW